MKFHEKIIIIILIMAFGLTTSSIAFIIKEIIGV